jgi:hypothetical protein
VGRVRVKIKRVEPLPWFPQFKDSLGPLGSFFEGAGFGQLAEPSVRITFEYDGQEGKVVVPASWDEGRAIEEIRRFVERRKGERFPEELLRRWRGLEGMEFEV